MKYKRRLCHGIVAGFLVLGQTAWGQISKQAQAGFRFLENPINAEVVGRGGYGITNLHNASAVFWNPAGLGWISSRYDLGVHYTRGIADINQTSAALAVSLGDAGILALSGIVMDYGDFFGTRRPGPGDSPQDREQGYVETGTFSPQAGAFGVGYSRAVTDRFSFGVHLKLAYQDLGAAYIGEILDEGAGGDTTIVPKTYVKRVPAADVGAYYDFQLYGITFGATVVNMSREVRYENEPFPLPFAMKFGSSLRPLSLLGLSLPQHDLILGVETSNGRDFGEKIHVGLEYRLYNTFILRAGYMGNYSDRGVSFGFGIHYANIRYEYAFQDFGAFGGIQLMSVGVQTGS